MYNGIRAASWWAALYFIALVVLGNFIVLNLFLAILLGQFEGNAELLLRTCLCLNTRCCTETCGFA